MIRPEIPVFVLTRDPSVGNALDGRVFADRMEMEWATRPYGGQVVRVVDSRIAGWALACESGQPIIALIEHGSQAVAAMSAGATWVLTLPLDPLIAAANVKAARRRVFAEHEASLDRQTVAMALDLLSEAVEVCDESARIVWVNRRFEELTGYTRAESLGRTPRELLRSDAHDPRYFESIQHTLDRNGIWTGGLISRAKDGRLLEQRATAQLVFDCRGNRVRHVGIREDASANRGTNPAILREMQRMAHEAERYRTLIAATDLAILVVDGHTANFVEANPAAAELLGYTVSELRNLQGRDLTGPADLQRLAYMSAELAAGRAVRLEDLEVLRKDGSSLFVQFSIAPFTVAGELRHVAMLRDTTEGVLRDRALKESEAQLEAAQQRLVHSERLAALGQLAASVAHEVNNPLQYVLVSLQEATELSQDEVLHRLLDDAIDGVRRIAAVAQGMLGFSRVDLREESVDLVEVVQAALRLTTNEVRHRATLHVDLQPVARTIADPVRIGQVVTNLVLNAAQAIEEGAAQQNRISVGLLQLDQTVTLQVSDSGTGMVPEVVERIFEPFFTTKPRGQGTGLGLPVCQQIIEAHGGTIHAASQLGEGTTMTVTLPVREPVPTALTPVPFDGEHQARVLIIDDEPAVARAYQRLLARRHEVEVLTDAREARALLETREFDVVLCDLMMPEVDGVMLFESLASQPHLQQRFIFCSGGAFTPRAQHFIQRVPNRLVEKPVDGPTLLRVIDEALTRRSA